MYKNLSSKSINVSGRQSEVIEAALSYKFKSISLNIEEFAADVKTFGLPHARRLIDSARIQIGTFNLPLTGEDWENLDKDFLPKLDQVGKFAELAAQVGCTRALTTIPPASDLRPYHENFEFYRKRIGDVAKVLHAQGIRLGLEVIATAEQRRGRAFQFIHSLDALVQLAKLVSPDNVGVVADLWQLHVSGVGLEGLRKIPANRLVAVYLSDLPTGAKAETVTEAARLLPGDSGVIDSAGALTILAELGYDGPITARVAGEHLPGKNRDEKIRTVSERLTKLWNEAGLDASGRLAAEASS